MALVLLNEGFSVIPGDVIYSTALDADDAQTTTSNGGDDDETAALASSSANVIAPGSGTTLRRCVRRSRPDADGSFNITSLERRVVATRTGVVHWSDNGQEVSVVNNPLSATTTLAASTTTATSSSATNNGATVVPSLDSANISSDVALGAKPGDTVHLRVTRITPTFVGGDVIAIRNHWCCNRASGTSSGFRGLIRAEDIKPFKPSKDKLTPDAPSDSMRPGDVVVAVVISQSDAKVYQLSTIPDHCGVVESTVVVAANTQTAMEQQRSHQDDTSNTGQQVEKGIPSIRRYTQRVALQFVPQKRNVMIHPITGASVPKWTPLLK